MSWSRILDPEAVKEWREMVRRNMEEEIVVVRTEEKMGMSAAGVKMAEQIEGSLKKYGGKEKWK